MSEQLGKISRFNSAGFEVVIQLPQGGLARMRCSYNLWANIKRDYSIGDIVNVDYTRIDDVNVVRSFVKRNDLVDLFDVDVRMEQAEEERFNTRFENLPEQGKLWG